MQIKTIKDKSIWEKFISKYSPQSLFQSWNWGETIRQENKNSKETYFRRVGFYQNHSLIGIAQLHGVYAKKGAFLHIRHGPIFKKWEKNIVSDFLAQIKKTAKTNDFLFVRISPLIENTERNKKLLNLNNFHNAPIHALDGEYCWVLDIKKDKNILLSDMRKTTRYLIRKAKKMDIKIQKSTNYRCLHDFFVLYEKTSKRHGFVPHKGIKEEFRVFLKDKQAILFNGYFEKRLVSSAIILFYNHQAIYHHSASIEHKAPVNYLLQWEVIKEAKKRNKKIYNFWGIAPKDKSRHPWKGLSLFKRGFGGEVKEYLHIQDCPLSCLYCATYIYETIRKYKRGY